MASLLAKLKKTRVDEFSVRSPAVQLPPRCGSIALTASMSAYRFVLPINSDSKAFCMRTKFFSGSVGATKTSAPSVKSTREWWMLRQDDKQWARRLREGKKALKPWSFPGRWTTLIHVIQLVRLDGKLFPQDKALHERKSQTKIHSNFAGHQHPAGPCLVLNAVNLVLCVH
jgi:hypothetical protein